MSYVSTGRRSGFKGFGAYDYAADHAAWLQEKAAAEKAGMAYAAASAGAAASYSSNLASYNANLANWNKLQAAYAAAIVARSQQQLKNQQVRDAANAAARAKGAVTPAGYPGCVTQAQHDSWQASCAWSGTTVKGLGADPTGSFCALAALPVCTPAIPMPVSPGPKPVPPPPPVVQAPVPPALRPEPQPPAATPPVLNTTPQQIPSSAPSPTPPTPALPTKSAGLLKNGLILIVLAGGGYALYRTFKKPKAA